MKNIKYTEPCSVSGDDCSCPAAYGVNSGIYVCDYTKGEEKGMGARLICFACGEPVCENCSGVYDYYDYGKRVICDNCAEDHDLEKVIIQKINNVNIL